MEKYKPQNDDERAAMEAAYPGTIMIWDRHVRDLQAGAPSARVLALPDANYYIFLSNEDEVVREMRRFAANLH